MSSPAVRARRYSLRRASPPAQSASAAAAIELVFSNLNLLQHIAWQLPLSCNFLPPSFTPSGRSRLVFTPNGWYVEGERTPPAVVLIGGASFAAFCRTSTLCRAALISIARERCLLLWPELEFLLPPHPSRDVPDAFSLAPASSADAWYARLRLRLAAQLSVLAPRVEPPVSPTLSLADLRVELAITSRGSFDAEAGALLFVSAMPMLEAGVEQRRRSLRRARPRGTFKLPNQMSSQQFCGQGSVFPMCVGIMAREEGAERTLLEAWGPTVGVSVFLSRSDGAHACLATGCLPVEKWTSWGGDELEFEESLQELLEPQGNEPWEIALGCFGEGLCCSVYFWAQMVQGMRPGLDTWHETMRDLYEVDAGEAPATERVCVHGAPVLECVRADTTAATKGKVRSMCNLCRLYIDEAHLMFSLKRGGGEAEEDRLLEALNTLRWCSDR